MRQNKKNSYESIVRTISWIKDNNLSFNYKEMKIDINYQRILVGSLLLLALGWAFQQQNAEPMSGHLSMLLSDKLQNDRSLVILVAALVTIVAVVVLFPIISNKPTLRPNALRQLMMSLLSIS